MKGQGCKLCSLKESADKRKMTFEEFIERAREIHGDKYDYSKVKYDGINTQVTIICYNHDPPYEFPQAPHNHLQGQGCPYCNESKGARKIRLFLINNNIEFEREKRFDDCRDKNPLPFDFYLQPYNLCIEYDGEQHFIPTDFSSSLTEEEKLEKLKTVQKRDQIKNNYCEQKGINLLRIKYTENIEEKLTEYFQTHKV